MSNKLDANFFVKLQKKKSDPTTQQLDNRLDYIFKTVGKAFNLKIAGWYVYDAPEGERGTLSKIIGQHIEIQSCIFYDKSFKNITFDGCHIFIKNKNYDLSYDFPKRWLFEDFEQELLNGKKQYEKWLKQEETKKKQNKIEQARLIKSAKSKLTNEELKALNLK